MDVASHKVGMSTWHLVWATKYRYKMMREPGNKNLVAAAIRKKTVEHGIKILELAVQEDHVHTMAKIPLTMSVSKVMQLLKGGSAYIIFRNKPKFRLRYPRGHFWSPGGCYTTVGHADMETITHYIRNQDAHHAAA